MKNNMVKKQHRNIILADYNKVSDPFAEAFRMLRLQIYSSMEEDSPGKIVLITSSVEKEGKTTIVCNLAQMCAIAQIPTILIDTDLRRPIIHRVFGIPKSPGISDVLLSDTKIDFPIVKTLIPNLSVLPAGKFSKHTTELLGSPKFEKLLKDLKQSFKLIILDSPPAGIVADVGVIASKIDAIYMVVQSGSTKIRTVRQVVRTLRDLGGNIKGIILSRINPRKERYYYYHYYPHYYSSYYSQEKAEETSQKQGVLHLQHDE